jgi:hypothetical protein
MDFSSLSPGRIALLSAAVAVALSDGLTSGETNDLGNFLSSVGQLLQLISAHQQLFPDSEAAGPG